MDNYIKKVIAMQEAGKIPKKTMGNLNVQHDSWCRKLTGAKGIVWECNCDPDIQWFPADTPEEFASTFMALNGMSTKH